MAKRRRLTPAQTGYLSPAPRVPIAQVTGQAAAAAALQELSDAMSAARSEGRLVQRLALETVDAFHLVRDRIETDEAELAHLVTSIRAHGQRVPIEVTEIAPGRYGLISGWRRLTALDRLWRETGEDRFASVLALERRPETAADAYVAMVEENEIRLALSYYERARIAARAVDLGVFDTEKTALQRLYAAASRAKRSKIGSFLGLYRRLDGVLRFPAAIPERLGLALAQVLDADPAAAGALAARLAADPPGSAAAEGRILTAFLKARRTAPPIPDPGPQELRPGVFLKVEGGWTRPVLVLSGPAVDPMFRARLEAWLKDGH
jgi:ParB-like chromosome segregation protein Spo0J